MLYSNEIWKSFCILLYCFRIGVVNTFHEAQLCCLYILSRNKTFFWARQTDLLTTGQSLRFHWFTPSLYCLYMSRVSEALWFNVLYERMSLATSRKKHQLIKISAEQSWHLKQTEFQTLPHLHGFFTDPAESELHSLLCSSLFQESPSLSPWFKKLITTNIW